MLCLEKVSSTGAIFWVSSQAVTDSSKTYHPAPMTRTKSGPSPLSTGQNTPAISLDKSIATGLSPQARMMAPFRRESNDVTSTDPESGIGPIDSEQARIIAETLEKTNWHGQNWNKEVTDFPRSARYYGPTSFSSVFTENELMDSSETPTAHPSSWKFGQPLLGRDRPSAPSVRMNQIIRALWNIPSREACESLMDTHGSHMHVSLNPVLVSHNLSTLWSTFNEQLSAPRSLEKLTPLAEVLFQNEEKVLPPSPDDGIEVCWSTPMLL
jgi:hypothetical protein